MVSGTESRPPVIPAGLAFRTRVILRLSASALSGTLLVLALPKPDFYYLGWIALVPLLLVLAECHSLRSAALAGYVAGLAFFSGSCYWIVATMSTYGGLSVPLSVAVFALFVVVFAGHTALFGLLLNRQIRRFGLWGLPFAAPLWVGVELAQSHLIFGGFPWMLAGYALAPFGGVRQMVAWTGIYGLSFLLVAVASAFAAAIRTRNVKLAAGAAVAASVCMLLPTPGDPVQSDPLSVRLVQTNIDLDQSWAAADRDRLMDELEALSVRDRPDVDLLIWPEAPGPFYLDSGSFFASRTRSIARDLDATFLFNYIGWVGEQPTNSVAILGTGGEQLARYDKIHLVPFGEYVPLQELLFFAESMVRNVGNFRPGTETTVSSINGRGLAATICYEDVFPDLIRRFTAGGAEVIVNITNDGWFGETSAPHQHLRMSAVRAAENRRYVVRGANTGITAIIDPYGSVLASTEIGERVVLDGVAGYRQDLTFYVRFGNVFAYLAVGISAFGLAWPAAFRRTPAQREA